MSNENQALKQIVKILGRSAIICFLFSKTFTSKVCVATFMTTDHIELLLYSPSTPWQHTHTLHVRQRDRCNFCLYCQQYHYYHSRISCLIYFIWAFHVTKFSVNTVNITTIILTPAGHATSKSLSEKG